MKPSVKEISFSKDIGCYRVSLWSARYMEVETRSGIEILPMDLVGVCYDVIDNDDGKFAEAIQEFIDENYDFLPSDNPEDYIEVRAKEGYLVQWTMPGYMDQGELYAFESLREACIHFRQEVTELRGE